MITISHEHPADFAAREVLLDRAFGPRRRRKTAEHLRRGRMPAEGLAFSAHGDDGRLVASVRLWEIEAGSAGPALLLGPIAVDPSLRNMGVGSALMRHAIGEAQKRGHRAVVLVGDEPYYRRFGFSREAVADLRLPGPVDRDRLLGLELAEGGLAGARGIVTACGRAEEISLPKSARAFAR